MSHVKLVIPLSSLGRRVVSRRGSQLNPCLTSGLPLQFHHVMFTWEPATDTVRQHFEALNVRSVPDPGLSCGNQGPDSTNVCIYIYISVGSYPSLSCPILFQQSLVTRSRLPWPTTVMDVQNLKQSVKKSPSKFCLFRVFACSCSCLALIPLNVPYIAAFLWYESFHVHCSTHPMLVLGSGESKHIHTLANGHFFKCEHWQG